MYLFLAEFLRVAAEEAGLMAFLILETFHAVLAACPALANTCSVASPASSPYLYNQNMLLLINTFELSHKNKIV